MMKTIFLLAALVVSTSVDCSAENNSPQKQSAPDTGKKWELVWEDNFEKDGLPDPKIWGYEVGYVRNREAQFYTEGRSENARVENGCLVIEARKDNWEGHEITSASLHTYGKKSMLYGRIEVKAKLPTGKGTWPAIWMLGDNHREGTRWPDCGEIDIMENVGYDPDHIFANVHTKKYNHSIGTGRGSSIVMDKPYENFYVYALEWDESELRFYVDDQLYFTCQNDGTGVEAWPFDQPQYLILNLAIGGAWGGKQGIAEDLLPQKYYIDYVRVYKQK
ncbi:glycoside hydrolase family 16 protein [Maribellus sp. YY47]|uniref:glycoside hydrolase family 16 protein n=1 Tax=Maribellus sp. YY47 TaxID=2929486 RepID=UPI00200134DB|nr:glycoside hydrolase family 16 protein [Maribellus sp. YY47]MCK3684317.1 glycoside hydrolase family 16 protein [Maribellus sp. YY47]